MKAPDWTPSSSLLNPPGTVDNGEELTPPEEVIFGVSPAMQLVRTRIERIAPTNIPILITGESGTGKEVIARMIHRHSKWASGPLVKVNCPAIPGSLLESELFGYEKGAFTGANLTKPGRVELAHEGTLFLDEIGELDPGLQSKLLQLLQENCFMRLGARQESRVRMRFLCATNRNLEVEVEARRFRQDLYYRINVVSLTLPPLRERAQDIPVLVEYFLRQLSARYGRPYEPLIPAQMAMLRAYNWPGNIRELENQIKSYVILGTLQHVENEASHRSADAGARLAGEISPDGSFPLKNVTRRAIHEMEREIILKVLEANQWNRKQTAQVLRISYRALLYKLKEAGITRRRNPLPVAPPSEPAA